MAFSLFARHPFELSHISSGYGGSIKGQMVNLCDFSARLVVFYEQLNVLYTLELDKLQWDRVAFQVTWRKSGIEK